MRAPIHFCRSGSQLEAASQGTKQPGEKRQRVPHLPRVPISPGWFCLWFAHKDYSSGPGSGFPRTGDTQQHLRDRRTIHTQRQLSHNRDLIVAP